MKVQSFVSYCLFFMISFFGAHVYAQDAAPATVAMDYRIQPGDTLSISVWGEKDMQRETLVRPDGGISFPLAGDVTVTGKSVVQVRAELTERLTRYIPGPAVDVSVLKTEGNRVFVIGQVKEPGEFVLASGIDVLQALSLAGGATPFAKLNSIRILRRQPGSTDQTVIPFDYKSVVNGDRLDMNIPLMAGDTVVVP